MTYTVVCDTCKNCSRIVSGKINPNLFRGSPYNLPFTILPHILREFRDSVHLMGNEYCK